MRQAGAERFYLCRWLPTRHRQMGSIESTVPSVLEAQTVFCQIRRPKPRGRQGQCMGGRGSGMASNPNSLYYVFSELHVVERRDLSGGCCVQPSPVVGSGIDGGEGEDILVDL